MNYNHNIIIKNKNNSPHILTHPIFEKKLNQHNHVTLSKNLT